MPVIQVNDKQHTLKQGQTRLGGGPGVDVAVSADETLGLQAVLEVGGDNRAIIRRARDGAQVKVNGVMLGVEPTPLMHGDKIDVAGKDVLFSEDKKVGATAFISAADVAGIAAVNAKRSGPARATSNTGGRLVSLVDGKEYVIPNAGAFFGREAGSDVVVAQPEVSRRHASITPGDGGYVLQDLSTNGVWVNGNRVQGSHVLARADVVRVGSEEFRFYADVAPVAPKAATPSVAPAAVPAPAPAPAPAAVSAPPAPPPRPEPPTAPRPEPPTAPSAPPAARKPEPPTAPRVEPPTAPVGAKAKPKKEGPSAAPVAAVKEEKKSGGKTQWIWIVLVVIIAAAAYFIGQGRG
jgi:pSer/pThr/pTyr-binding forkhead associated (FHA) protein